VSVRQRGKKKVWYYDFMIDGIRYKGRIRKARSKKSALDAEADIRQKIARGEPSETIGSAAFIGYAEDVFLPWSMDNKKTWQDDKYHIRTFRQYFGEKTFNEITPAQIEKFKRDRFKCPTKFGRPRTPASVNREVELLSKIFNLAIRDGVTAQNPCKGVRTYREDNERTRYLTEEEEARLLASFNGPREHLRPVVILAIYTGMRRGEILSREWRHIDFGLGVIRVTRTKTGRDRSIPMNEVVRAELLKLHAATGGVGPVFPSMKTGEALVEIKKGFAAARAAAGTPDLHFHDLRHTFGTRLAANGASPFTIAELLGHSDLRMTRRYTHATSQSLRAAVNSLASENYLSQISAK